MLLCVVPDGYFNVLKSAQFMRQLMQLYPDCVLLSVIEFTLVSIPAFPNLVLQIRPAWVEFRIVTDPAADPTDWRAASNVWKRLPYPMVRDLGLRPLLEWAGKVAVSRNRRDSPNAE
jgi:hypothetical protein